MADWVHKGSLMGPQGPKGDTGETGPKGDAGETGPKGDTGATGATPVISMTATVDQTTGTPNVSVRKSGSDEAPSFNLAITGIKGEKGDKGDTGEQGPQGDTGPQGPKGEDATLPEGGTDGQVLTKVSDGVEWKNVSLPPGYLRANGDGEVSARGYPITSLNLQNDTFLSSLKIAASDFSGITAGSVGSDIRLKIGCSEVDATFTMMNKTVSSITDSISSSPAGNSLATDKAVADYINSLIATDEEFNTYFGLS